jgi:coenzyme F420-reducing hydrogenase delta subunit
MENAVKDGFTYDADAVVIPVKCTGLVKVSYLLKLFAGGIRGVLVLGCDEGDCRYYNGSSRCAEIVDETREILDLAGMDRERLQFHRIAESGGDEVKRVLKGFLRRFEKAGAAHPGRDGRGKRKRAKLAGTRNKRKQAARSASTSGRRRAGHKSKTAGGKSGVTPRKGKKGGSSGRRK